MACLMGKVTINRNFSLTCLDKESLPWSTTPSLDRNGPWPLPQSPQAESSAAEKMNIITNVWLFPLNWLYLAQDGKLKWILENFLIVSVWLRISCSNSRIRRELVGLLMFTLSSAIAALEARLVVVRLGAEDQALDGDQHLEVRSLCWI